MVSRPELPLNRKRLGTYAVEPGRYDELLDVEGKPREHWDPLITRLLAEGSDVTRRDLQRLCRPPGT